MVISIHDVISNVGLRPAHISMTVTHTPVDGANYNYRTYQFRLAEGKPDFVIKTTAAGRRLMQREFSGTISLTHYPASDLHPHVLKFVNYYPLGLKYAENPPLQGHGIAAALELGMLRDIRAAFGPNALIGHEEPADMCDARKAQYAKRGQDPFQPYTVQACIEFIESHLARPRTQRGH